MIPMSKITSDNSEKMLAVTVNGGARSVQVRKPSAGTGEVVIRVERVGICGTDWAMLNGYSDFRGIIGHEFAGIVIESESAIIAGTRVTASINIPKDIDSALDWKKAKHDPDRTAMGIRGRDGAMAEFVALPENILHKLPDNVDYASGAMAEPLAAALHAVELIPSDADETLIVGDGRLAQLVARGLRYQGIPAAVLGKSLKKMGMMRKSGARIIEDDHAKNGDLFQYIIEASGDEKGIQTAIDLVRPEGTVILKSTMAQLNEIDLSKVVVKEVKLIGSRCGDIAKALRFINSGEIEVNDLISAVYPLKQAARAFEAMKNPDTIKIQLSPHGN